MCTKIQQFDNKLVLPLIFQFAVPSQHYSLNPIFFSTDILQNWIPKNCMILQIKYRFDYFFGPSRLTGWQPTSPLISFISHSKWWVGILYTAGSWTHALVLWVHGCQGLVLHACVQQWASALDLSVLLCLPCLICTSGFFCSSFTIHSLCLSILLDFTSLIRYRRQRLPLKRRSTLVELQWKPKSRLAGTMQEGMFLSQYLRRTAHTARS